MNEKLKALRLKLGMTQYEVCMATGIQQDQLSRWENGKGYRPGIDNLKKLADLYCVKVDDLL